MQIETGHVLCKIIGKFPQHIIDSATSYLMPNYFFSPAFKKGHWDGRIRYTKYNKTQDCHTFPTGFLTRVCAALDEKEYNYQLIDNREYPEVEPDYIVYDNKKGQLDIRVGKRDYQADVLEKALLHSRGIIKMATGLGKTLTAAAIMKSIGGNWIFLTHRINLLYQTKAVLEERLRQPIGIFCGDEKDIKPITVAMVQSVANYKKRGNEEMFNYIRSLTGLIGDEIHHLESEQWFDVILDIPAPFRYGLSATPELDNSGMNLLALTGDIIADVSVQEGISRGVLVPPRIWLVNITEPSTTSDNYQQIYKELIVNNSFRNRESVRVCKQFKKEKKSVLLLVRQINHGKELVSMLEEEDIKAKFIYGKVSEEQRQEWILGLTEGRIDVIVGQSSVFTEGFDMPSLRALINATGGGGDDNGDDRAIIQFTGRGLRETEGKLYFDLVDFNDHTHKMLRKATDRRIDTLIKQGYGDFINNWCDY